MAGIEWEWEDALAGNRERAVPDLLLDRKTMIPEAKLTSREQVDRQLRRKEQVELYARRAKASAENDRPRPAPQLLQQVGFFLKAFRSSGPKRNTGLADFPKLASTWGRMLSALKAERTAPPSAIRSAQPGGLPPRLGDESFAISTSPGVRYCVGTENGCSYDAGNGLLDEGEPEKIVGVNQSYIEAHAPTVREQLVKVGVRLSTLLNQVLDE